MLPLRIAVGCIASFLLVSFGTRPAAAQSQVKITLDAGQVTATLPDIAYGLNVDPADAAMSDSSLPAMLAQTGISALRFPGGSIADEYHWRTNSATRGTDPGINPHDTFDAFMTLAKAVRAQPIVTVNYGSNAAGTGGGSPAEAAAWVADAKAKDDGVQYWEIGDEVYGNGEYGAHWDEDLHHDHSPSAYGRNALDFIRAMKAADPTIKVGVSLTAPGVWPDGAAPNWNSAVLQQCGSKIDFVSIHWYPEQPGHSDDGALLSSTGQIPDMMSRLRALINQYCGENAQNVQIFVTRTDAMAYNPTAQTVGIVNAIFLPDDLLTWLENGAANVDWWVLHSGPYGKGAYGDLGLFSTGQAPEPAVDTPFPSYDGLEMLGGLGRPGDRIVRVKSDQPLVAAHALLRADGSVGLLLINKDPSNSYTVTTKVNGFHTAAKAAVYTYSKETTKIAPVVFQAGHTFTRTVAPYSLSVYVLEPYVARQHKAKRARPRAVPRYRPAPKPFRIIRPRRFRRVRGVVVL